MRNKDTGSFELQNFTNDHNVQSQGKLFQSLKLLDQWQKLKMGDLGTALGYKTSDTETGEPRGSKGSPRLSNSQNKALLITYKTGLP